MTLSMLVEENHNPQSTVLIVDDRHDHLNLGNTRQTLLAYLSHGKASLRLACVCAP
eukprot:SAG31_NODE_44190_length_263_cov_8.213415_1_plen_55_part_01